MPGSVTRTAELEYLLAHSDFGSLRSAAERLLFSGLLQGDEIYADCSPGRAEDAIDAASPDQWHGNQEIRGGLLRWVYEHLPSAAETTLSSITIRGARFVHSPVDLSGAVRPITIELNYCRFEKQPDFSGARFTALSLDRSWVPSLFAKGIVINEGLSLNGFRSEGKVSLERAKIGGDLDLQPSIVANVDPGKPASVLWSILGAPRSCREGDTENCILIADWENMQIGGSIYLDHCQVRGQMDLIGSNIGADLDFGASQIDGMGRTCVLLDKVSVSGLIFFDDGFQAVGVLAIRNSVVRNGIEAGKAHFKKYGDENRKHYALELNGSEISGDSSFGSECDFDGVSFRDAKFERLAFLASAGQTGLDLRDTKAVQYIDQPDHWPAKGALLLDGFTYNRIAAQDVDGRDITIYSRRIEWLHRDTTNSSQPYVHYAKILQEEGHEAMAKEVLKELAGMSFANGGILDKTEGVLTYGIGYGYAPQNAIGALAVLTGLGWLIYRRAYLKGGITPTDKDAHAAFSIEGRPPAYYPKFSSFIYSLENTFPLVKLGQADKWRPNPTPSRDHTAKEHPGRAKIGELNVKRRAGWSALVPRSLRDDPLRFFLWLQILLGWVFATLFVAGISGLIRK